MGHRPTHRIDACAPLAVAASMEWQLVGVAGLLAETTPCLGGAMPQRPGGGAWRAAAAGPGVLAYDGPMHADAWTQGGQSTPEGLPGSAIAALRRDLGVALASLQRLAGRHGLRVIGGGLHPLQGWTRTATLRPAQPPHPWRTQSLVVRVGSGGGDRSVGLAHALARFVPHVAALAAASPIAHGVDTGYDSARLHTLHLGRQPAALPWCEDLESFAALAAADALVAARLGRAPGGWDVTPLPAAAALELRVADAPLSVEQAVRIVALVRCLVRWLLLEAPFEPVPEDCALHAHNRHVAARLGFEARLVGRGGTSRWLQDELEALLERLRPHALALGCKAELAALAHRAGERLNDAALMRQWRADGADATGLVARAAGLLAREQAGSSVRPDPGPPAALLAARRAAGARSYSAAVATAAGAVSAWPSGRR